MLTQWIESHNCGTFFAGWLDGAHPSNIGEEVERTICFASNTDNCEIRAQVMVKKCPDFFLYKLPVVPACISRYCGCDHETFPNICLQ